MFPQTPLPILLLTLILTTTTLALPPKLQHQNIARQARIEAFDAQRPLPTTALLAGAAAKATPASTSEDPRVRDLRIVTGESGLWVFLDDLQRGGGEDEGYDHTVKARERLVRVRQSEEG